MAYGYILDTPSGVIPPNAPITAVEIDFNFLNNAPQPILFAALQVSFMSAGNVSYGGNHFGIQWNQYEAASKGGKAVNFGGYVDPPGRAAGVPYEFDAVNNFYLDTGQNFNPTIFSGPGNTYDRTCAYNFPVGTAQRFRVEHIGAGTWHCTVNGIAFRDSFWPGTTHIDNLVFWTEYGTVPCQVRFSRIKFWAGATEYRVGPVQVAYGAGAGEKRVRLDTTGIVMDVMTTGQVIADGAIVTVPFEPFPVQNFYRAVVTATGPGGSASKPSNVVQSQTTVVPAPSQITAPAISSPGTLWRAGEVWTTTTGTWNNASSFSYLWQTGASSTGPWSTAPPSAAGGNVNSSSYAPPVANLGQWYRSEIVATGPGGSTTAHSPSRQSTEEVINATSIDAPPGKCLWGAHCPARSGANPSTEGLNNWLQASGGVRPDAIHYYFPDLNSFTGNIPAVNGGNYEALLLGNGTPGQRAIPFMNWKFASANTLAAIANGAIDAKATSVANQLKTYHNKVILCFFHEYDKQTPFGTGMQPNDFADANRRVITVMRNAGATNVEFAWNMTGYGGNTGNNGSIYNALWPGDDMITWLTWNPYAPNFAARGNLVQLLTKTTGGSGGWPGMYAWATTPKTIGVNGLRYTFKGDRKLGTGEWGTWYASDPVEGPDTAADAGTYTDAQAATFLDTFDEQMVQFPRMRLMMHYNDNHFHKNHIDGHPLSEAAMSRISHAPIFTVDMSAVP